MASQPVSIKSNNTLYPGSNFILNKNESFWFEYLPRTQKWVRVGFDMGLKNSIAGLPTTFDSRFYTNYLQGAVGNHVLPKVAEDRAEAFVGANSLQRNDNPIFSNINTSQPYVITASGIKDINTNRTLSLFTKNKTLIHYMYVADRQHWVPMSLGLVDHSSSIGSKPSYGVEYYNWPLAYVKFDDSNYKNDFILSGNGYNYFITLDNTTNKSINLDLGAGRSDKLLPGERARYKSINGVFARETSTIDLVLVNSPEVSNAIGASAAKIRLLEAVALTNQIAANSNANMYIRVAGYLEYGVNGTDLSDDLELVRVVDATIQTERTRLGADGIYYQSTKGGACGWGTIRASAPQRMAAVGRYDCGLYTMAHEVGHNLGLRHGNETGFDPNQYQKGFSNSLSGKTTIMNVWGEDADTSFPYYSSPDIYDSRYLTRLGNDVDSDSVKQINRYAPIISAFATATQ